MIEAGLHRIIDRLEEIGSAAGKEFALETAMEKMKLVIFSIILLYQGLKDEIGHF